MFWRFQEGGVRQWREALPLKELNLPKHSLRSFHVLQWLMFRQAAGNLIGPFWLVKQIWTSSDCYMCKRKTKSPRLLPLPFTFSVVKSSWCKSQRPLWWGWAECADAGPQGTKTSVCALGEGGWRERPREVHRSRALSYPLHGCIMLSMTWCGCNTQWLRIMITPLSRVSFVPSSSFRWLPKKGDEKC